MNSSLRVKKIPLWLGNTIEVIGIAIGVFSLLISTGFPTLKKLPFLLVSWICFWYFTHCLAHYIVGKIFRVEFLYYYIGKSAILKLRMPVFEPFKLIPVLGIKTNRESLRKVSKKKVAIFYSSGVLSSTFFPVATLFFATDLVFLFLLLLTISNAIFTLIFSSKVGDLKKAREALKSSQSKIS